MTITPQVMIPQTPKRSGKALSSGTPKFGELSMAERRKKIGAFCDSLNQSWKDQPETQAVKFLVKLRRGK